MQSYFWGIILARVIHKPRREVPEMSVMARKARKPTGMEKGDRHLFHLSGKRLSVPLFPGDRRGRPRIEDRAPAQAGQERSDARLARSSRTRRTLGVRRSDRGPSITKQLAFVTSLASNGERAGDRTQDFLLKRQVLYLLSYTLNQATIYRKN